MASLSDLKLSHNTVKLPQGQNDPKSIAAHFSGVSRVGGYLYVIGLLHVAKVDINQPVIAVLDIRRENKWVAVPYPGSMVRFPHIVVFDDVLYVYANRDWKGDGSGLLSRFDLIEEEWSYCTTTGTGPGARLYCSGDYLEKLNCFVVFGGYNKDTDVHVLCLPECKWIVPAVKGQPPVARHGHGSCVYQDVIYYYGGWTGTLRQNDGVFLLTFTRRDVATWSVVQSTVRTYIMLSSLEMFPFKGKIFICGGLTARGMPHGLSTYDPKTEKFKRAHEVTGLGVAIGVGSSAFIIDGGQSFGLICGHARIADYNRMEVITNP